MLYRLKKYAIASPRVLGLNRIKADERNMNIHQIQDALLWCALINFGLLLWWALFIVFAHDFVYRMHTKWFVMTRERFDAIHYAGMMLYKLAIVLFNLVPYIVLHIVV